MAGLTDHDTRILKSYADSGNRELYWNYLSQLPGADGYGTLALGVVRNDSVPGAVANSYAQDYAATQQDKGSRFANAELSEREWDAFGQTLLMQDLERRNHWMQQSRPDLALNLPGKDVMQAHDRAFEMHGLDPNCWTPRVLLQAATEKSGPEKAEHIWKDMLDNEWGGAIRAGRTAAHVRSEMPAMEGIGYFAKLSALEASAILANRATVDPNVIGSKSVFHIYDGKEQKWYAASIGAGNVALLEEKNPARIDSLNDTRELRLERQEKAGAFHPDDPYRDITRSPRTVSVDGPDQPGQTATWLADIGPGHADYALLQQVRQGVAALDARQGRSFDDTSERLTASLMVLARQNDLERADHVVLSNATPNHHAGRNVFVVQGAIADPAHQRAMMPTELAVQTPVEQSLQQLEVISQDRQQKAVAMQAEQQVQDERSQQSQGAAMRMG